jgi:hypothetical protein
VRSQGVIRRHYSGWPTLCAFAFGKGWAPRLVLYVLNKVNYRDGEYQNYGHAFAHNPAYTSVCRNRRNEQIEHANGDDPGQRDVARAPV